MTRGVQLLQYPLITEGPLIKTQSHALTWKYLYFAVTFLALLGRAHALSANEIEDDTNIVVLSDPAHYEREPRKQAVQFMVDLKATHPKFDCLLLEWGRDSNPAISDYIHHVKSYQDSIGVDIARITQILGRTPYQLVPEFLLSSAAEPGLKVFAVDVDRRTNSPVWKDDEYERSLHDVIEVRNEAGAIEIDSHFKQNQCHKAVLIFGLGHTITVDNGYSVKPIQAFLQDLGYHTQLFPLVGI
jgi:hypothetical protein